MNLQLRTSLCLCAFNCVHHCASIQLYTSLCLYFSYYVLVSVDCARMKTLKGEKGNDIDAKLFLKMALWLVVYYQFYNTGVRGGACRQGRNQAQL